MSNTILQNHLKRELTKVVIPSCGQFDYYNKKGIVQKILKVVGLFITLSGDGFGFYDSNGS